MTISFVLRPQQTLHGLVSMDCDLKIHERVTIALALTECSENTRHGFHDLPHWFDTQELFHSQLNGVSCARHLHEERLILLQ